MDSLYGASSSNTQNHDDYFQNLEFLRTPVKHFAKLDYKKLQTFVAAMGLPSNLKRKQLLAIIVAKKLGKDNMIPAILKEVIRQRNQRRQHVKQVVNRPRLTNTNRIFPPKIAPLPSHIISDKVTPLLNPYVSEITTNTLTNKHIKSYYGVECINYIDSIKLMSVNLDRSEGFIQQNIQVNGFNSAFYQGSYYNSNIAYQNYKQSTATHAATTSFVYKPAAIRANGPIILEYFYEVRHTKKYETNTTPTVIMSKDSYDKKSIANTTPVYSRTISSAAEYKAFFDAIVAETPNDDVQNSEVELQIPEQLVDMALNSNEEVNLDAILDYVMGDEKENTEEQSSNSPTNSDSQELNNTDTVESERPESDISIGIHYLTLLYNSMLEKRSLWPLQRSNLNFNLTTNNIFDCLSLIVSDTNVLYTIPSITIPAYFEHASNYTPKACNYQASQPNSTVQNEVPQYCLLRPENSVCYRTPSLVYGSKDGANTEYNTNYPLNNNLFSAKQTDSVGVSQIQYNVILPSNDNLDSNNSSAFINLQPRVRKVNAPILDVHPTIDLVTPEEEMMAYNSLGNVNNINININDNTRQLAQAEHSSLCLTGKLPCPYFTTLCTWFDNLPLMAQHIRRMHHEKIIVKKNSEYLINHVLLGMMNDKTVKIIQEYNSRLCYIFLCTYNDYIIITVQEFCESIEQHHNKIKARLTMKHPNGNRVWNGYVQNMAVPLGHLWRTEYALILPLQSLRRHTTVYFKLLVEIGI